MIMERYRYRMDVMVHTLNPEKTIIKFQRMLNPKGLMKIPAKKLLKKLLQKAVEVGGTKSQKM